MMMAMACEPNGAPSMPSCVDLVQSVPDVHTDVTVRAFLFTFKRMLGVGACGGVAALARVAPSMLVSPFTAVTRPR